MGQQSSYLCRRPLILARWRSHPVDVQLRCDSPETARAFCLHLVHYGQHVRCSCCYLTAARLPCRCRHLCRGRGRGGVAEANTTRLRYGQGRARALADQPEVG
jgi:hypothetical protein